MVKAGKWFRSFLAGKREKNQEKDSIETSIWRQLPPPPPPPTTPKDNKIISFNHFSPSLPANRSSFFQSEQRRHSIAVSSARVYAAAGRADGRKIRFIPMEEIAAIKIQSSFRSCLARKALRALKGVVKLQAVVRGLLARQQAAAAVGSMRAADLLIEQNRDGLLQRDQLMERFHQEMPWRRSFQRKMMVDFNSQQLHKSKEKDQCPTQSKSSLSPSEFKVSSASLTASNQLPSAAPPRAKPLRTMRSSKEFVIPPETTATYPNYMANTESWKAKARSQTAPRQRPDQSSRQRANEA